MLAHRSISVKWMLRLRFIAIATALVGFILTMHRYHDWLFCYWSIGLLAIGTVQFIASFFTGAKRHDG